MGSGLVFWLMMINIATAAGWLFLVVHNDKLKRMAFVAGCFVLTCYFIVVSFIHFNAYILHHSQNIPGAIFLRFLSAVLGFIGTAIFVLNANRYERT